MGAHTFHITVKPNSLPDENKKCLKKACHMWSLLLHVRLSIHNKEDHKVDEALQVPVSYMFFLNEPVAHLQFRYYVIRSCNPSEYSHQKTGSAEYIDG